MAFLETECGFREAIQLTGVQSHGAVIFEFRHQFVGNLVEHIHFLFANAQQIIVVSRALDDRTRRALHAGGVVNQYRRIARPGTNRAFAGLHCGFHHAGTAGDAQ